MSEVLKYFWSYAISCNYLALQMATLQLIIKGQRMICDWLNEQWQELLVAKGEELTCIYKCFMEAYSEATYMSGLLND